MRATDEDCGTAVQSQAVRSTINVKETSRVKTWKFGPEKRTPQI